LGVTGIALFVIGFVLIWNKRLKREVVLREKIETALKESEKKFKALFNNAQVALFRTRISDGKLLEINERYANMAGYPTVEACMAEFNSADAWVDAGGRDKLVRLLEDTVSILDYETKIIRRDKTAIWIIFSATIFPEQGYIEGSIVDITPRKQAEQALKERTDFLDKIIDTAALSTWISDEKGTVIRANPACLAFFGATHEEVVGRYNLFKDVVIEKNGFMPDIRAVFERGTAANLVIDYDFGAVDHVNVKNATHKTVNSIFTPIKDVHGKVSNVIVQTIDLTPIKQMENALIQSRRMESIGTLAGGIAHEFNNVLSIIIGNNELVMQELPRGIAWESCKDIQIAGMRARDVVKQLLTFSRQDTAARTVMDIRSVVAESMKLIRSSTPANIEIQQRLADDVPPILGNDTQINQLLINLCNNAVDAIPKVGGILAVDLCSETVDNAHANSHPKLKPGPYVKLSIRDNGAGMEKAIRDRVFEPYFTTKEIGKGTGIGLAVVHGIVERHQGSIIAESHPGQGSRFTILLPAHEGDLVQVVDDQTFLPRGKEQILYVDDEPAIANLGRRHLESLGYRAESTTDPLNALARVKMDPDKFDLVISDMAMPKMTGDQLVGEILKICPDMPTIICTGYSAQISEKEAGEMGINSFLMKPVGRADLAQTNRQVLDTNKREKI
jgi:PAS domain S-box-containing protein